MYNIFHSGDTEHRISIFKDTMKQCCDNKQLSDSIKNTIADTKIYQPGFKFNLNCTDPQKCSVTVTMERTFECADRLHKEYPDSRITVLNFASATNPGGGVKTGSSAQEECLCRCSTLYSCISTEELFREFYSMHRKKRICAILIPAFTVRILLFSSRTLPFRK